MTREEIMELDAQGIEERNAAIDEEIKVATTDAELDSAVEERKLLAERKSQLDIELEKRKADMKAVVEGAGVKIAAAPVKEERTLESVRSSEEYLNAYADYIKTGKDAECRALLTNLVEGGSVPIPTAIDNVIATAWDRSNLVSRVRKTTIKGTAKYPFEYSATGASVHTEGAAAPNEEQLVLGTVEITPQMLKKWITISDEVLALKGQEFLNYIYDEIEFRILALADATIVTAIKSASASASTTAAGVRALTPSAITASTIFNALATLSSEAKNPVAIMNKQTYFNQFMALTDLSNRPIYDVVTANGKPSYFINGIEVIFDNTLATGAAAEILVGDLDGIVMNLPDGRDVSFVTDPYSLAERDLVKIVGKLYAGIGVIRDGYFCKVTVTE